jgi:N6-L-threonylcarbamoyladenine synthase
MENMWSLEKIWSSNDDAAWESYDKVAKMMWLSYPGWPIISKLAFDFETGLEKRPVSGSLFPRVWLDKTKFDFSFSGLKSAVKR